MRMRALWIGLLVLLLVLGSGLLAAGADGPAPAAAEGPTARAAGSFTATAHGTAWVPEIRAEFARWRPVGWGMQAKVKPAGVGDQWVHIPLTAAPFVDGSLTGLYSLSFCARSSYGARTMPIQVDVWNGSVRIHGEPVTWWADNAEHCWTIDFAQPKWVMTLGVSVLLHFANTTDQITLEGATASFTHS